MPSNTVLQSTYLKLTTGYPKISELAKPERPANKLRERGPNTLSDQELLACILQTQDALNQAHTLLNTYELRHIANHPHELTNIPGLGRATIARLLATFELARRIQTTQANLLGPIRHARDIAEVLQAKYGHLEQEHFVVVPMNTRNSVITIKTLYIGTLNTSIVRISEILRIAIQHNAASIIVAHNHPSGDPGPSPEDVALTRRINRAMQLIEIDLLDHIVIGENRFYSLREHGLGFDTE